MSDERCETRDERRETRDERQERQRRLKRNERVEIIVISIGGVPATLTVVFTVSPAFPRIRT